MPITVYLHAVNSSKPVYRVSTKHAALPKVKLEVTDLEPGSGKRVSVSVETSAAHKTFRKKMGFNDQSDAKRAAIGLRAQYYKQ